MNFPTRTVAAALGGAFTLGLAGAAHACDCRVHHVRHDYHPARYYAPVRYGYVRRVVRPVYYTPTYDPGWYGTRDYQPYDYWRPYRVVRYEQPYYWRYHRDWDDDDRWRGRGRHRGWEERHEHWRHGDHDRD